MSERFAPSGSTIDNETADSQAKGVVFKVCLWRLAGNLLDNDPCKTARSGPMFQTYMQQFMMIAGLGLICWLLLRGKMRGRRQLQAPTTFSLGHNSNARATAAPFSGTNSLGAPPEVLRWQVELHDLGRELKAELDSKLIAVRTMSNSYDQAARRLAEMIRLAEQTQIPLTSPLVEARRLAALGWQFAKIAQALNLTEADVEQLLGSADLNTFKHTI